MIVEEPETKNGAIGPVFCCFVFVMCERYSAHQLSCIRLQRTDVHQLCGDAALGLSFLLATGYEARYPCVKVSPNENNCLGVTITRN